MLTGTAAYRGSDAAPVWDFQALKLAEEERAKAPLAAAAAAAAAAGAEGEEGQCQATEDDEECAPSWG